VGRSWLSTIARARGTVAEHPGTPILSARPMLLPHRLVSRFRRGYGAGVSRRADAVVSTVGYALSSVPKVAFLTLIMVPFGLCYTSKILLLFSVMLFRLVTAARDGVRGISASGARDTGCIDTRAC